MSSVQRKRSAANAASKADRPTAEPLGQLADGKLAFAVILTLAVVLLVSLWAAVLYKAKVEEVHVEETIHRDTMNLARAFEEHTIRTLGSVDQALLFVKHQYEKIGDRLDIAEAVSGGMIISSLFNQVGVINAQGIYHLSNIPNFNRVDLSDREHFRVHLDADTNAYFVSKPVLGRATGKWSLQLTRRINRADGSFGGVAVISVDPFYFTSFYSEVDVGKRGVVTLFGLDGIVRARRSGDMTEVGQDISRSQLMNLIKDAPAGHFVETSPVDGVLRSHSYRRLPGLQLGVLVGVDREGAMADFEARKAGYFRFAGAMTLIIVAFAGLSAWLLHRQRMISLRLRESQERAESSNRLKSEFLASVSHELRTPLNGIIGYADLLRETVEDEAHREYASVIFDSSQHLLELVNSILDMARVEAGEMKLKPEPVPVAALVAEVCATYQPIAARKGLALSGSGPQDEQTSIVCDRMRVAQILNNLVHNALKFTDSGFVRVSATVDGRSCIFEVADSGCGIDPRDQELIFERFRQADLFLTRSQGGAGLGLALCRELAELMGGEVMLQSEPGQGSIFRLVVPVAPKEIA
ncbi:two-component sensor histidine kinase [Thauera propionica]|uniref:Virulence sensor protein BvgS n=2 Tax=Thauera TaxID=33057 RepID=A0A235EXD0_9RHOO|nr:ATP-binding protein [Thauera propionica]OYD53641.1 two-component sensor histidine kinase [Thauera propionica]